MTRSSKSKGVASRHCECSMARGATLTGMTTNPVIASGGAFCRSAAIPTFDRGGDHLRKASTALARGWRGGATAQTTGLAVTGSMSLGAEAPFAGAWQSPLSTNPETATAQTKGHRSDGIGFIRRWHAHQAPQRRKTLSRLRSPPSISRGSRRRLVRGFSRWGRCESLS